MMLIVCCSGGVLESYLFDGEATFEPRRQPSIISTALSSRSEIGRRRESRARRQRLNESIDLLNHLCGVLFDFLLDFDCFGWRVDKFDQRSTPLCRIEGSLDLVLFLKDVISL